MASDTKAATEAKQRNAELRKSFGEFIPDGSDPQKIYDQWNAALFGDRELKEGLNRDEILLFALNQAKIAGIDLRVAGQMWINEEGKVITTIEGMVTIAEKTGKYGGTTRPEYEFGDDGKTIVSCTLGVHKLLGDHLVVSEQTVYFDEYDTGEGFWMAAPDGKPKTMIKKVAHAHCLRASFSMCNGMYIAEEVEKGVAKTGKTRDQQKDEMQDRINKGLAKKKAAGKSNLKAIKPKPVK